MRKRTLRARARIHAVGAVLMITALGILAGVAGGLDCNTLTILEAQPWMGAALIGVECGVQLLNV